MTGITPACKLIIGPSILPYTNLFGDVFGDLFGVNDLCEERVALMTTFLESQIEKLKAQILSLRQQALAKDQNLDKDIACTQETLRAMEELARPGYASELFMLTNHENLNIELDWYWQYPLRVEICPDKDSCGCDLLHMDFAHDQAFKKNGKQMKKLISSSQKCGTWKLKDL